jgi:DNA-binding NtrC family response regulator
MNAGERTATGESAVSTTRVHAPRTVMVIDDSEMIAKLLHVIIDNESDLTFLRGDTDVTRLMDDKSWRNVDVAVVDLLLPRTTGDTLLRWLEEHEPHIRRVAMSAAGDDRLAQAERVADVTLLKPFMIDDLLDAVRS